jgi:hypothetical protein
MDPFWKTFFEEFKERGRDASPFLITLAAMFGLLLLAGIAESCGWMDRLVAAVPWVGTIAAAAVLGWLVAAIRRARHHPPRGWERQELSCDEWRAARSKLKRNQNRNGA